MLEAVVTLLWKFREFGIRRRSVESLMVCSIISLLFFIRDDFYPWVFLRDSYYSCTPRSWTCTPRYDDYWRRARKMLPTIKYVTDRLRISNLLLFPQALPNNLLRRCTETPIFYLAKFSPNILFKTPSQAFTQVTCTCLLQLRELYIKWS